MKSQNLTTDEAMKILELSVNVTNACVEQNMVKRVEDISDYTNKIFETLEALYKKSTGLG